MIIQRTIIFTFLTSFFLFIQQGRCQEDPDEIVAKADLVRVPKGSFELEAIVENYEGRRKKGENGYRIYAKDLDHVLVQFRSPASEKGKSLLALAEDLWIYLPKVKKPVRIPLQQRLSGEISNGDVIRLNFAHDYEATLIVEEKFKDQRTYVLDLKARSSKKTYNKIKYWVKKEDYMPMKAEYFTVSGKSLKTCFFKDQREAAGRIRPMRLVFRDSLNKNKKSILVFKSMTEKKFADKMFTKDHMKTLE
jgi:outer membrane lipoprotein-sorting protein